MRTERRRRLLPIGVACAATALALVGGQASAAGGPAAAVHNRPQATSIQPSSAGGARANATSGPPGDPDGGVDDPTSADLQYFQEQRANVVAPGAYDAAFAQLQSMAHTGGSWSDVTDQPYNSDDPVYRDYDSNSSAGDGEVTGRITGLAADNDGHVYTRARPTAASGARTPAAATGRPSPTNCRRRPPAIWSSTPRAGSGMRPGRPTPPATRSPATMPCSRTRQGATWLVGQVGGSGLDFGEHPQAADHLRNTVWAATTHGVWTHSVDNLSGPWKLQFAPNPAYLPGDSVAPGHQGPPEERRQRHRARGPEEPGASCSTRLAQPVIHTTVSTPGGRRAGPDHLLPRRPADGH